VAPSPGLYTIRELGPGVSRHASLAVGAVAPQPSPSTPVDLRAARVTSTAGPPPSLDAWFLIAALCVLALEWLYWSSRRRTLGVS
jgi:hypothetical protein